MKPSENWPHALLSLSMGAFAAFAALLLAAVLTYPGGSLLDPAASGFDPTANFLSDLGRTVTFEGEPKVASLAIFAMALCAASLGVACYFAAVPAQFPGRGRSCARVGSAFGLLAAVSLVGVALTPWDAHRFLHLDLLRTALGAFVVATLADALAVRLEPSLPGRHALGFVLLAALVAACSAFAAPGTSTFSARALKMQTVGQQVAIGSALLGMFVQARSARRRAAPPRAG